MYDKVLSYPDKWWGSIDTEIDINDINKSKIFFTYGDQKLIFSKNESQKGRLLVIGNKKYEFATMNTVW